jgi:hypothetical protein
VSVRDKIRTLRREANELEESGDAIEEEQAARYLRALEVERSMVTQQLAAARSRPPDEHERCVADPNTPSLAAVARLSWGERADVLERRLAAVERELERIT